MDYKIEHFNTFDDKRGRLVVFLNRSSLEKKHLDFGQIYFVTFEKKGIVRGNHYHKTWQEWFGVVIGKVQVKLRDINSKEEVDLILDAKEQEYMRLMIGPMIAHAFKNLSSYSALLNYADKEWKKEDSFPCKILH